MPPSKLTYIVMRKSYSPFSRKNTGFFTIFFLNLTFWSWKRFARTSAIKGVIDIYSKEPRENFPKNQYGGFNMAAQISKKMWKNDISLIHTLWSHLISLYFIWIKFCVKLRWESEKYEIYTGIRPSSAENMRNIISLDIKATKRNQVIITVSLQIHHFICE